MGMLADLQKTWELLKVWGDLIPGDKCPECTGTEKGLLILKDPETFVCWYPRLVCSLHPSTHGIYLSDEWYHRIKGISLSEIRK